MEKKQQDTTGVTGSKQFQNYIRLQYLLNTKASSILRDIFCKKWKCFTQSDWENTRECGEKFVQGPGTNIHKEGTKSLKNILQTGNIAIWDVGLLVRSIRCLDNTEGDQETFKNLDKLKQIRNELAHLSTAGATDGDFEKYWTDVSRILITLGVSQEDLNQIKETSQYYSDASTNDFTNENVKTAEELKKKGNLLFADKKYEEAIEVYNSAVMLSGIPPQDLAILYSNRSITFLKLGDLASAKEDAKCVTLIHPTWWKGYFRLATSYEQMEKYEQAIKYNEMAIEMGPPESEINKINESLYFCRRKLGMERREEHSDPMKFAHTNRQDIAEDMNKRFGTSVDGDELEYNHELLEKFGCTKTVPVSICADGHRYLHGIGVPQNYQLAAKSFEKAASMGNAEGIYNLAMLTRDGKGVKRNSQKAIELLKQAAAQKPFVPMIPGEPQSPQFYNIGVREAEHSLGIAHDEGSGVPKDHKLAFSWYSRALEHGCEVSANNIACMYELGDVGGRPNIDKAILYWKYGSYCGVVRAMENLVLTYLQLEDITNAFVWYKLAMENGSLSLSTYAKLFEREQQKYFNSQLFKDELTNEMKRGQFKDLVLQKEQMDKNAASLLKSKGKLGTTTGNSIIVDHRLSLQRQMKSKEIWGTNPAKLTPKPTIDMIGLKPILFKDIKLHKDHIYEGFAIKLTIIEDAILGKPSVAVIGQDEDGGIQRIFVYNIPQNKETQDVIGYGCRITIVNPYYRCICQDTKPAIRVDEPSTIIYHPELTDKTRCRQCGKEKGKVKCRKCRRAFYCSQNCLKLDESKNQHELVCVKHL